MAAVLEAYAIEDAAEGFVGLVQREAAFLGFKRVALHGFEGPEYGAFFEFGQGMHVAELEEACGEFDFGKAAVVAFEVVGAGAFGELSA